MRFRANLVVLCVLILTLTLSAWRSPTSLALRPAPRLADPTAAAKPLVTRFFVLLKEHDTAGLNRLLSPAFQVVRADGSTSGKTAYLANLPSVESFDITHVFATQSGSVLVARYVVTATGLVNGKPYTPGPAPRLSVFSWNGSRWQLAGHANFNPLTG